MADISKITLPDNVTYDLKASKIEYNAMGVIGQGTIPLVITSPNEPDGADGDVGHTGKNSGTGIDEDNCLCSKNVKLPHTYSTKQHIVGYWTDGSPIYEKTVSYSATISSGGNVTVPTATWSQKAQPIDIVLYSTTTASKLVWRFVTAQINSSGVLQIFNGRAATLTFDTFTIQYVTLT